MEETRQGISMKPTRKIKVSFFSPALISLFFFPHLQREVAVFVFNHSVSFMCPLKRCAAVVANQLRSSVAQRAQWEESCLLVFYPSLIQYHD